MVELSVTAKATVPVRFLRAKCGVRYWEDATVNGVEDEDGSRIPHRNGDAWEPLIDLDTGVIQDWPAGVAADIHYKVCDDGSYHLLDADQREVSKIDGYVPTIMSPGGPGYGDYVIMTVDETGKIADWSPDLSSFEEA